MNVRCANHGAIVRMNRKLFWRHRLRTLVPVVLGAVTGAAMFLGLKLAEILLP